MSIGDNIKLRRQRLGLSVDELASRIGKNRATVYRYESKEIENMPLSILEPLAAALQTTPDELMGWSAQYSKSELIDLYARGLAKWSLDPRFNEQQKYFVQDYVAESLLRLKTVVEYMAKTQKTDSMLLPNQDLDSALENASIWVRNGVNYVNQDCREISYNEELSNDEIELLEIYRQISTKGKEYIKQTLTIANQAYSKE